MGDLTLFWLLTWGQHGQPIEVIQNLHRLVSEDQSSI